MLKHYVDTFSYFFILPRGILTYKLIKDIVLLKLKKKKFLENSWQKQQTIHFSRGEKNTAKGE